MMLRKKQHYFQPANLAPGGTTLLGTDVPFSIDNTFPIEEILVFVNVTCGATGPTLSGVDNVLGIVKKINLSINDNNQPRSIVDFSGIGLLEYCQQVDDGLDADTLNAVALAQGSTIANNLKFRICYRIPIIHPALAEPLRTRCLLPVHTWNQQPKLTISFEQAANMYSAGSLSSVSAEVVLIRRNMSVDLTNAILADGGFISFDLIETAFTVGVGVSGEQKFALPSPGSYLNILCRQYLGGASVTRAELDQVATFGAEQRWRLETGGVVEHEWRWKHLRALNSMRQKQNSANQTYSPVIGGVIAANTSFSPSATGLLDFISDGIPGGEAGELGSVLDLNIPTRSGLKMEIIGSVPNTATNGSTIYIGGHRLYGDLSKWQANRAK